MAENGSKDIEMGSRNIDSKPEFVGGMAEVKEDAPYFPRRNRGCVRCCAIVCCLVVLLVIVLVILAFTVFKVKKPVIEIRNVDLESFNANFHLSFPPKISINLTLGLDLYIKNRNKASFRYSNSTTNLLYRGNEVGMVQIPPGSIRAGGTEEISTSLILLADRIISSVHLLPDLISGSLPLTTTTDISGRVSILGFIKHHVDVFSECDISVSLAGSLNRTCKYDIDL